YLTRSVRVTLSWTYVGSASPAFTSSQRGAMSLTLRRPDEKRAHALPLLVVERVLHRVDRPHARLALARRDRLQAALHRQHVAREDRPVVDDLGALVEELPDVPLHLRPRARSGIRVLAERDRQRRRADQARVAAALRLGLVEVDGVVQADRARELADAGLVDVDGRGRPFLADQRLVGILGHRRGYLLGCCGRAKSCAARRPAQVGRDQASAGRASARPACAGRARRLARVQPRDRSWGGRGGRIEAADGAPSGSWKKDAGIGSDWPICVQALSPHVSPPVHGPAPQQSKRIGSAGSSSLTFSHHTNCGAPPACGYTMPLATKPS